MNVVDACMMASELPPSQWDVEVISPINHRPYGIFGYSQTAMGRDHQVTLLDALLWTELSPSKTQARAAIKGGAVSINRIKERDEKRVLTSGDALPNVDAIVLENGKFNYGIVEMCD